jgi:hypothetical protein
MLRIRGKWIDLNRPDTSTGGSVNRPYLERGLPSYSSGIKT